MNNTVLHQKFLDKVLLAVGSLPHVRCWPRFVGFDETRKIKYGIKGESDLQGIVAPLGRMLCIEIKTGNAKLSKEQIIFKNMVEKFGAIYIEARLIGENYNDSVVVVLDQLKKHL